MGRTMKVYPSQVKDCLSENSEPISVREIAGNLGCTTATVRNKLRILRRDGEKIAPTQKGIYLIGKVNQGNAKLIFQSAKWVISVARMTAEIGHVIRLPFSEAKKFLMKAEDRKELKRTSLDLLRLVDAIDIEEEYEPLQLEK
jgi:biotin operon repressor